MHRNTWASLSISLVIATGLLGLLCASNTGAALGGGYYIVIGVFFKMIPGSDRPGLYTATANEATGICLTVTSDARTIVFE